MKDNPLVSVIIPAYNSEKFIGETILSVIGQYYDNIEVFIIDDGSTDNQKDIALDYCGQDVRFKYYFRENQGVSASRNYGAGLSNGVFLAFLDADDVWHPENIDLKVQKFKEDDYGLVHSDGLLINEKSDLIPGVLKGKEGWLLDDLLAWKDTQIPGPSSILVRKDVFDLIGGFDTELSTSADQDFFLRVASRYKIGRVADTTWKYRMHSLNMHKDIKTMEKDIIYVYKKADHNDLFKSNSFRNKCFANMYLILGASWLGEGANILRFLKYFIQAVSCYPPVIFNVIGKAINKLIRI